MGEINDRWLYNLLPEVHRNRDYYQGMPLLAFMKVFEEVLQRMHGSMDRLYDDWFIETAEDGAVPLIAQLVNCPIAVDALEAIPTLRSLAANSISDRRRKGTIGALEAVLRDSSAWAIRVLESGPLVATSIDLRDQIIGTMGFVDLRKTLDMEVQGSSFYRNSRTWALDSRSKENEPTFNLNTVDVFVWRLSAFLVERAQPYMVAPNCYTFHPFGIDIPLFNHPKRRFWRYISTERTSLPCPITRVALREEVEARVEGLKPETEFLGARPSIEICIKNHDLISEDVFFVAIPPQEILVRELSNWLSAEQFPKGKTVAIDPETGRFQVRADDSLDEYWVTYAYSAVGAFGGGPYAQPVSPDVQNAVVLSQLKLHDLSVTEKNLGDTYVLPESARYNFPETIVVIPDGTRLSIQAAPGICPVLVGNIRVQCPFGRASLSFSGIWFDGSLEVTGAIEVSISNCTFSPIHALEDETPSIIGTSLGENMPVLAVSHSISGPIQFPGTTLVSVTDSLIDGGNDKAVFGDAENDGPALTLERSTTFGGIVANSILAASNCIFDGPVWAKRVDIGFARYSAIPAGSRVPAPYRCVPASGISPFLRPLFQSKAFGSPGYGQLDLLTSELILNGAEDGGEMGVFNTLMDTLRRRQLRNAAQDYLPVGMKAVFIFET